MRTDVEYTARPPAPLLCVRRGDRVRLLKTGDPPPKYFVRPRDLSWEWGIGEREFVAVSEEIALDAAWERFRSTAVVPEAGALVMEVMHLTTGGALVCMQCRNGGVVGYPLEALREWETYDE